MNGWTPERRKKQAAAIQRWRPWEHSTGPRTSIGKAASMRNAWSGKNRPWWRAVGVILAMYRRHPGAETAAQCEPHSEREKAAFEVYERRHPLKLRYIDPRIK